MNNQLTSILGAIVRHGLGLAAGGLLTNGTVTSSEVEVVSGALTAIVVTLWSVWQKKRTVAK